MRRNVEIKARIPDLVALDERAASIASEGPTLLVQEDVFFSCPQGRLKLRRFSASEGELIYYERPDARDPKECSYIVSPTSNPDSLRDALSLSLGIKGIVRKKRTLYRTGQTRIHLDEVEELGRFVELEVILEPAQSAGEGARIARELMDHLGIAESSLVDRSYIDLLLESSS